MLANQCNCEFLGCDTNMHHLIREGCGNKPEILAEILGHKVTLCFPCYMRQTVCLAPNEYKILESA